MPLLTLPHRIRMKILKEFDLEHFVELSLCSKASQQHVKNIFTDRFSMIIHIHPDVSNQIQLFPIDDPDDVTYFWFVESHCLDEEHKTAPTEEEAIQNRYKQTRTINGHTVPCDTILRTKFKDDLTGALVIGQHLMETFGARIEKLEATFLDEAELVKFTEFVMKMKPEMKKCKIDSEKKISDKKIERLLDILNVTEKLYLRIGENLRIRRSFKMDRLGLSSSINFKNLMAMDCVRIGVGKGIGNHGFNAFLKKWIQGSFPRLSQFGFEHDGRISWDIMTRGVGAFHKNMSIITSRYNNMRVKNKHGKVAKIELIHVKDKPYSIITFGTLDD